MAEKERARPLAGTSTVPGIGHLLKIVEADEETVDKDQKTDLPTEPVKSEASVLEPTAPVDTVYTSEEKVRTRNPRRSRQSGGEVASPVPERVVREHRPGRIAFSTSIRSDILERAWDAVYWTPGLNKRSFVEKAFLAYIDELEKKYGKPFTPRPVDEEVE